MSVSAVLDLLGALLLAAGAFFCLAAAVGLVRFPDVLSRMHAATKPQVFGLSLLLAGVALSLRDVRVLIGLALVVVLQVLTSPVSGHMMARAAYRTGQWDPQQLVVDELADDLNQAGFNRNEEFRPERGTDRPRGS